MPDKQTKDHAAKPLPFFVSWGLPGILLVSTNSLSGYVPLPVIVALMAGAFLWMGLACVLNARRCRRRHWYYSGPIFLLGALAVLLVGFELISLGPDGLIMVVAATVTFAMLTYLTEPVFGKYVD